MRSFKIVILAFLFPFVAGCIKEEMTNMNGFLINKSSVEIQLVPFSKGIKIDKKALLLSNGDTVRIGNGMQRGLISGYGFQSDLINSQIDSMLVVYDNSDTVVHYCHDFHIVDCSKCIFNGELRNVFNGSNYDLEEISHSRYSKTINNYFTFTESDYEFARE